MLATSNVESKVLALASLNVSLFEKSIEMARSFHDIGASESVAQYHSNKRFEVFIEEIGREKFSEIFVDGDSIDDMTIFDVFRELHSLHVSASNCIFDANNIDLDDNDDFDDPDRLDLEASELFSLIKTKSGSLISFLNANK